jgi:hypothetical protein
LRCRFRQHFGQGTAFIRVLAPIALAKGEAGQGMKKMQGAGFSVHTFFIESQH